ncbi:putative ribonuclease H-like domain-containing protein [Tanacetum coccineum]
MDLETAQTATTAKLPILKQEWKSFKPVPQTTTNVDGTSTTLIPVLVTTEEKVQKKNDVKARSMLLMALPNEHLMTFNQYKDAKTLFAAIQTRFGGNEATKKTQKTLLKSLPSEWNTHVVVWRNKPDLDTMSFDDLYNNFKIVEQEVKGTASLSSSSSSQNMAFVSSPNSTNEVNTTCGVSTANTQVSPASAQVSTASTQVSTTNLSDDTVYAFLASQPNGSQLVYEDLEQIHEDDIEEMNFKWQLALLSMRTRRGPRNQDSRNRNQDSSRRTVNVEETSSKAMVIFTPNLDLSNSGLKEFSQPEFEGYGPKTSKNVSEDTSNEVRESTDALMVEKLVLDDKLEKKTVFPTVAKIEFIENLVDKKVKIIRCDNGTEFKNRVMSEFCEKKGIKKEFSIARTPQQNGVIEKRNRTLIKAARIMLADSKLPTIFWAEAVNTAFYVQNRVLVVKPHNKTPYELFRGRTPALSFMRPFRCHVTILNTLDYLGKFDGKSDEGFFDGYSMNSKAFRVYNIRTRKVEENLHIRFLEDKPIIAGTEESIGAGHSSKETGSSQDYILMPLWKDGSLFDSSSKNASNDEPQRSSDAGKKDDEGVNKESGFDDQERSKNSTQDVNTVRPSINTASTNVNTSSLNINITSGVRQEVICKDYKLNKGLIRRAQKGNPSIKRSKLDRSYAKKSFKFQVTTGWTLVELPNGKEPIDINGVYRKQEMMKGRMDVKSTFLYGKIEEEVYVCQPLGFEDPEFLDRVYKGIPLVNTGELPEMDPYEEVAQQGQTHPLSPAYVPDPVELDEHEDTDADSIDYPDEPEDGEEDEDEDPEEDPSEEHDPEDDGDDDDTDDKDEEPTEDEEEEEHPALVDSSMVPVVDPVPSAGDIEAFETDESAPTPRSPQNKVPFSQTRLCRA